MITAFLKVFGEKCVQFMDADELLFIIAINSQLLCIRGYKHLQKKQQEWENECNTSDFSYWIVRPPKSLSLKYYIGRYLKHYEYVDVPHENFFSIYEPFFNFLNNTRYSLDIAFMTFGSHHIYQKLLELLQNGIRIRIIVDYSANIEACIGGDLAKNGAEVIYFERATYGKSKPLFHWKYMLRDYKLGEGGCVYVGSANLSNSAYTRKTENLMFTTNRGLTKALNEQFNFFWYLVPIQNDPVNRFSYKTTIHTKFDSSDFTPYKTKYKDLLRNFGISSNMQFRVNRKISIFETVE